MAGNRWWVSPAAILMAALAVAGCNGDHGIESELQANGLVVILPGIEGAGELSYSIRAGLVNGGVDRAIVVWNWGRPIPLAGMLLNQVDFLGNRLAALGIANRIARYQEDYPGRPVHIVGHSGGGGVAVFVAEGLADKSGGSQIDGLILLSASISSRYDLTKALSSCKNGMVNFHNPRDVALLGIVTTLLGNVDGGHGPSAGLNGFRFPGGASSIRKQEAYKALYEREIVTMDGLGESPHFSATHPEFVTERAAPWVLSATWPLE